MININKKIKYDKELRQVFSATLNQASQDEGILDVNLIFTNGRNIRKLNSKFRGKDQVTDVLSFPLLNLKAGDVVSQENFKIDFNLESNSICLGDIYLCISKAKRQAKEYGHSVKREISYLFAHGLLHLLGYDHVEENDKKLMREKEKEVMSILDIKRENE